MKKSYGCLISALVVALLFSIGIIILLSTKAAIGSVGLADTRPELRQRVIAPGSRSGTIAQINVEGIISSMGGTTDSVKRALKQATDDPDVKAILLYVNSPGGEVTASDTIYNAVKKANAIKPVIVYMDALAASGGYYIACGATKIVASETTLTGSIGVIMQSLNYAELMDKVGLQTNTFRSGDFKDTLSGSRPMRDDEREYIQNLITQMYDKFVGIVSEARGVPVDTLKNGVADGRIVTGIDALKEKLVDQNGYIEDAYALAASTVNITNPRIIEYVQPATILDMLGIMGQAQQSNSQKIEIDLSKRLLPALEPGRAYYLPTLYAQ
jgi:protease-4